MKDFIITSLQSWDSTFGGNAKDIAYTLSRTHRVLYVNPSPAKKGRKVRLRNIQNNLWVLDYGFSPLPVNYLPDGLFFNLINRYNNYRIFRTVNQCAAQLHFQDITHFCDNDIYRSFYAREYLKASLYIYYRRDNLHPVSYWRHHIGRLEPSLIRKSDLVMCNSAELAEYAVPYLPHNRIYDIGQGVDLSAYQIDIPQDIPVECDGMSRPIIGYAGALSSARLDINLLYEVASSRPQYTFMLVGKRDEIFKQHPLGTLPNVVFAGLKPMEMMPYYIQAMDVCLNPQIVNEVTIGNYPRKVDEYLAMGKPVIATHTRTMEIFKDYVYLCSSADEYKEAIDRALAGNSPTLQKERIAFARTHSWECCVEKIYKAIEENESTKPIR